MPRNKAHSKSVKVPLRICHLADVHLGYRRYNRFTKQGFNQREVDVGHAFREAVDRCIALKPQLTVIAGDLFHVVRPSNAMLAFAFREVRRLATESEAPVILVAGNHETPRRTDTGSPLRLLAEIPGVWVAEQKVERFEFRGSSLAVTCIPHGQAANITREDARAAEGFDYNVLVVHAQVGTRMLSDFGGVELDLWRLNPHEWDYIALGHVHVRQDIALNASYAGSIEHTGTNLWLGFREVKGFLSIDLPEIKRTFHALTSPREVLVLEPIDCASLLASEISEKITKSLEGVAGGPEGKLIRLELLNCSREIYRQLDHSAIRALRARALHLSLEIVPPHSDEVAVRTTGFARSNLLGEIERFCLNCKHTQRGEARSKELWEMLRTYFVKLEHNDEASNPPT